MPSGLGETPARPPGKGYVAPPARRTCLALATTITGGVSPSSAIALAHVQPLSIPAFCRSSTLKSRPGSTAAGVETGDSKSRKRVNGSASSPAGGLIAARSWRYSGTRIRTFRKKTSRVPAARGSEPAAAAWTAVTCCCTSGGQAADCFVISSTVRCRVSASPRFAAMRASSRSAARFPGFDCRIV